MVGAIERDERIAMLAAQRMILQCDFHRHFNGSRPVIGIKYFCQRIRQNRTKPVRKLQRRFRDEPGHHDMLYFVTTRTCDRCISR